jgi:type IV secretion system protein VirD4
MEAAINVMCESPAWDGMLARMGYQLTHFKDKELASTLTTTGRFLRFLDTLAIAESTKQSSFDPADLLKGKTTVYLILPPEQIRVQSPLLRLWISSLLRTVIRAGLKEQKVHFLLDEAASLGHMDALDDALAIGRGYGLRIQWYFQSVSQLKLAFPDGKDGTLLSNTTQVYFGVNDYPTAEYVSARLGEETIIVTSGGTSTGRSRQTPDYGGHGSTSYSVNSNDNWQQSGRRLLKPEEVLALDHRTAITFTPGIPPLRTMLVRYYERGFREGWGALARLKVVFLSILTFAAAVMIVMALSGANIHRFLVR